MAILKALQANPVTAPYRFSVRVVRGQYALSGRVGTRQVHDVAIRTMIALGYPIRDDLTIDTGEMNRVAYQASTLQSAGSVYNTGTGALSSGFQYAYPPPLMGRLDDPFFGLEPPAISYPPWFGAITARREPGNVAMLNAPGPVDQPLSQQIQPAPASSNLAPAPAALNGAPIQVQPGQLPNLIEMALDSRGVATIRGQVPTLGDRVVIGQELARTPGVTEVVNLLEVNPNVRPATDIPPPPPAPALNSSPAPTAPTVVANEPLAPAAGSVVVDGDAVSQKVADSVSRRPALASAPLKIVTKDGVTTLSGHLPSSYEAMLAFRAAQQTPGVREVVDRLEFPLPDDDRPNPLLAKGRPEDISAYLLAQVRHQVGDLAHVDQLTVRGDSVEIRGTVSRADDVRRVEAALRSIPLLRGFRLDPTFQPD